MPKKPRISHAAIDNQLRSRDLQRRAEEFVSDELSFFEAEQLSQSLTDQFMAYGDALDEAEWVSSFELLEQGGMVLPVPDELDDAQLTVKLWEVIRGLAMLSTFLHSTDHLSDRQLYEALWHNVLREEGPAISLDEDSVCHIDLLGSGNEEDGDLYLRYYADEAERHHWAIDWPNVALPVHEDPPHDRDRHLPTQEQLEWRNCSRLC